MKTRARKVAANLFDSAYKWPAVIDRVVRNTCRHGEIGTVQSASNLGWIFSVTCCQACGQNISVRSKQDHAEPVKKRLRLRQDRPRQIYKDVAA